jgi:hypothetical protein
MRKIYGNANPTSQEIIIGEHEPVSLAHETITREQLKEAAVLLDLVVRIDRLIPHGVINLASREPGIERLEPHAPLRNTIALIVNVDRS